MRQPLDPEIMRDALPEDVHAIIDQVSANVNRSVDDLIQQFKTEAGKMVEDFKQQKFPQDLETQLQAIQSDYAKDMAGAVDQLGKVQAAAKRVADAAAAIPGLAADIKSLNDEATGLKSKLDDMHAKVQNFGQKAGGAIATAAFKAFTGGIA